MKLIKLGQRSNWGTAYIIARDIETYIKDITALQMDGLHIQVWHRIRRRIRPLLVYVHRMYDEEIHSGDFI